jgi:hypothetical protein
MAIYGWADPKMAALYTRKANRKRLAQDAMRHVVPSQTGNETVPLSDPIEDGGTDNPENARKINAI